VKRKDASGARAAGLPAAPTVSPADGPVVVQKAYDLALWLLRKVGGFPRSYRFSVGDRIVSGALDLLLLLVEAAYRSDKASSLAEASRRVNALRFLLRLANDLHLVSRDSYLHASGLLDEVGRMVGGWAKASAGARA